MEHQLQNDKLVDEISKWLDDDASIFFNGYIKDKQYELAERICRPFHKLISSLGYVFTPGIAYECFEQGLTIRRVYYLNSQGNKDGGYRVFDEYGVLIMHKIYENGVCVKDLLKDVKPPITKTQIETTK